MSVPREPRIENLFFVVTAPGPTVPSRQDAVSQLHTRPRNNQHFTPPPLISQHKHCRPLLLRMVAAPARVRIVLAIAPVSTTATRASHCRRTTLPSSRATRRGPHLFAFRHQQPYWLCCAPIAVPTDVRLPMRGHTSACTLPGTAAGPPASKHRLESLDALSSYVGPHDTLAAP